MSSGNSKIPIIFKMAERDTKGRFVKGHSLGLKKGHRPWNKVDGKSENRYRPIKIVNGRRRYVSHLVWCSQKGNLPYIPSGCVIHHIDLNPSNNKPDNLLLLPSGWHDEIHKKISGGVYG